MLLSDPSPAGGTYVTFSYSTPGIAAVSPDPAFIPAGQLAADIQIRGLARGHDEHHADRHRGERHGVELHRLRAGAARQPDAVRLGLGQYEPNVYVYTPTYTNVPVPVTVTSSDTNVATVAAVGDDPGRIVLRLLHDHGAGGSARRPSPLSAPGWTAASTDGGDRHHAVVGRLLLEQRLFTTSPQQNVTVYAEDSMRSSHYRTNSLVVHLRSTDTTVIRVLDTVVTIAAGQYYNNSGRFVIGGLAGSAYIVATASGHQRDSSQYTVNGPPLTFSWGGTPDIGAGQ